MSRSNSLLAFSKIQKSSTGALWPLLLTWSLMDDEMLLIVSLFLLFPKCPLQQTIKWRYVLPIISSPGTTHKLLDNWQAKMTRNTIPKWEKFLNVLRKWSLFMIRVGTEEKMEG